MLARLFGCVFVYSVGVLISYCACLLVCLSVCLCVSVFVVMFAC